MINSRRKSSFTLIIFFAVAITMIRSADYAEYGDDGTSCNCSQATSIANILYDRMFPSAVMKIEDIAKPKQLKNSDCFYMIYQNDYIVTGDGKSSSYKQEGHILSRTNNINCSILPPEPESLNQKSLVIKYTHITELKKNSFSTWTRIETLKLTLNNDLQKIEGGAFLGLENVWKLEIMDNPKLSSLKEDSLNGLNNLTGLWLQRNNISHITDISKALSFKNVPNLLHLDLTGNHILTIGENDFSPMKGIFLYTLIIGLTKTVYIHPNALDPFGDNLVALAFSEINVNKSILIKFINRTTVINRNLRYVTLEQNLFCGFPQDLMNVLANTIVGVSLKKNHFGLLKPGFFPTMHQLKYLDLTNVMMDEMPEDVINETVLPQLRHLYLGNNMFTQLTSAMVTPTITRLVLNKATMNKEDLDTASLNSDFVIEESVLETMPNLELLDLSGNNLIKLASDDTSCSCSTQDSCGIKLYKATELKVLLLKRTSLAEICIKSFQNNKKLYYLDLSYNPFPKISYLNKNVLYGLTSLLALDLSYCSILTLSDDIFTYSSKLQYLSLRGNPIYNFSPLTFLPVQQLKVLDLRYNIIVSWDSSLFSDRHCLKKLLLNFNSIVKLTNSMLKDFKKVERVDLYGNSISCDCDFILNLVSSGIYSNSSFMSRTMCSYPSIPENSLFEYYQKNPVSECTSYKIPIIACSVMAVLIIILILTVLYYKYKYDVQYKLLMLKKKFGIANIYRKQKNAVSRGCYQYDAFVSYSAHDSSFVEKMMMILEKDGSKYKLCVFERDFQPGDNLVDKIIECMTASMVTILILTEAFARSEWCRWEMSIAQNKTISQHFLKDSLILVVKSRIDDSLMTPTLKYLMDTRVYLEWHEHNSVRQNIFWEKLKDSLRERTQHHKNSRSSPIVSAPVSSVFKRKNIIHETVT